VIAHPTQDRPILSRLPTGSDLRQGQDKEPTVVVGEPNAAMHLTPQNDQLMSERRVLGFKPALRLEG